MTKSQLKRYREALGLTQGDIAYLVNYDSATVSDWETGRRKIPEPVQKRLVDYFSREIAAKIRECYDCNDELIALGRILKLPTTLGK